MKIYTMVNIDVATGEIISEESFEYSGAIAECKGGGSSDNVDEAYNARMATIAEEQEAMAQEYFDWYKAEYRPMEESQIAANMELIPQETAFQSAELQAGTELLPYQTEYEKTLAETETAKNQAALSLLPQQTAVSSAFYNEAINGVNLNDRADQAQADVAQAFAGTMDVANRELARMGVSPDSGAYAARAKEDSLSRAKAVADARTQARTEAEQENFDRLQSAFGGI